MPTVLTAVCVCSFDHHTLPGSWERDAVRSSVKRAAVVMYVQSSCVCTLYYAHLLHRVATMYDYAYVLWYTCRKPLLLPMLYPFIAIHHAGRMSVVDGASTSKGVFVLWGELWSCSGLLGR